LGRVDASDFETEHSIYREDAVLKYPSQASESVAATYITRAKQASRKRFAVRRIIGIGDLWVTEYILTYDGKPSYTVSIMEFSGDKVARETQYCRNRRLCGPKRMSASVQVFEPPAVTGRGWIVVTSG
jgi:hypothetical protein